MLQPELIELAVRIGTRVATAQETKLFLVQFQEKLASLKGLIDTLPRLA